MEISREKIRPADIATNRLFPAGPGVLLALSRAILSAPTAPRFFEDERKSADPAIRGYEGCGPMLKSGHQRQYPAAPDADLAFLTYHA
jgi:hypothetical protein